MFNVILVAMFAVSLAVGCSKFEVLSQSPVNEVEVPKLELGKFQYELSGLDSAGLPCSTGVQTLKSKHQVCMQLQNSMPNNDCALKERMRKFDIECGPQGYSFYESRECRVFVGSWSNLIPGTSDPIVPVLWKRFCVGRAFENNIINESIAGRVKIDALPGYSIDVVMSLGSRSSALSSVPSSAQISVVKDENGLIVGNPIHATSTSRSTSDVNFEGGVQIKLACNPVLQCE